MAIQRSSPCDVCVSSVQLQHSYSYIYPATLLSFMLFTSAGVLPRSHIDFVVMQRPSPPSKLPKTGPQQRPAVLRLSEASERVVQPLRVGEAGVKHKLITRSFVRRAEKHQKHTNVRQGTCQDARAPRVGDQGSGSPFPVVVELCTGC